MLQSNPRCILNYKNDGVQIQAKLFTDTVWTTLYPIDGYPCESNGYGGFDWG
ncbi:MAG: hypothetical protein ACP5FK_07980 [bacterium]